MASEITPGRKVLVEALADRYGGDDVFLADQRIARESVGIVLPLDDLREVLRKTTEYARTVLAIFPDDNGEVECDVADAHALLARLGEG